MARWRGRFPVGWSRLRRVWLTGAVALLALLAAGFVVLSWPVQRGASITSVGSHGGGTGSAAPKAATPSTGMAESGPAADRAVAAPAPEMAAPGAAGGSAPAQPPVGTPRQLVRTAQLTVEVDDATAATRQVRTTATAAGGLVVEEQTNDRGAWLVLRVPADALDKVIDDVAAIGTVTTRNAQVADRTAEVVDLDARVASQQASVARLRALLAQANSIGDVVAIESELARREADLDSLTNRLAALRDQVALSTLTIDLRAPAGPVTQPDERAVGFTDGLDAGWRGLVALGTATGAVVGFLLPFLPVLAMLFGLGWVARRIVRARRVVAAGAAGARSGPGSIGES